MTKDNAIHHDDLDEFIKELVKSLERHIIQQSSMTHVISSLKEMQALTALEDTWLRKLLFATLEDSDLDQLEQFGHDLHEVHQLSLNDVIDLIDSAQNYCLTSLPHTNILFSTEHIFDSVQQAKQHLAHGYFLSSVDTFVGRFHNGNFSDNPAMRLHQAWLIQLQQFFHDSNNSPSPTLEHSLCNFSKWLNTLEAKLVLHANENAEFDMQGNILLAHRTVHEEAGFITIFLSQKSYIKALSHFENLCQAFLLLDKYINEAHFTYLQDAYYHFIDFVMHESRHQRNLRYYFVIHYGLLDEASFNYQQKKTLLEQFATELKTALAEQKIDFICLAEDQRLHLAIQAPNNQHILQHQKIITRALEHVQKRANHSLFKQLYINGFGLSKLPTYNTDLFTALLNKIQAHKPQNRIHEVTDAEFKNYHHAVQQDLILLDAIEENLQHKSFQLHYQPIVTAENEINTVEVLIRLPLEHEVLEAADFLGVVEHHHLTTRIDATVIELLQKDLPTLSQVTQRVNLNVYPNSLAHEDVVEQLKTVARLAKEHQLELMVEITEHEALLNTEVLSELNRKCGVLFAVDDFGSGYSNLANLVEFASQKLVHIAKLDGSLIEDIDSDVTKFEVVKFTIEMATSLGLQPVILEYVDNEAKLNILKKLPNQLLYQGHYFNKALPLQALLTQYPTSK